VKSAKVTLLVFAAVALIGAPRAGTNRDIPNPVPPGVSSGYDIPNPVPPGSVSRFDISNPVPPSVA
jgi:hypothetical protein